MKLKLLASLVAAAFAAPVALASTSGVVISQVYGGGASANAAVTFKNDYVELFNASALPVNLNGWSLQYASSAGNFTSVVSIGNVILQPGRYFLFKLGSAGTAGAEVPNPDSTPSPMMTLNLAAAAGKVALVNTTAAVGSSFGSATVVDLVGYGTAANYSEGGTTPTGNLSITAAALRKNNGCTDTDNNAADFDVGTPAPRNGQTAAFLCSGGTPVNQPIVPTCADGSGESGQAFSFNVSATDADSRVNSATIANLPAGITLGALVTASADGELASQAINVAGTLAAGQYPLTLQWGNDEAQTASCTFKVVVSGVVAIPQIQGSGASSTLDGSTVTTTGIVTQLLNNGFYLQDPVGDADATTSDGIFVFTGTAPTVAVGDSIRLSALVDEYTAGNAAAGTLTELKDISSLSVLSAGNPLPQPVDVDLLARPNLEPLEGMRVRLHGGGAPLMVQQTNFLGSYGQLTLAAGGRTLNPTNVLRPGAAATALGNDNRARSIILDDGSSLTNPNPTPYLNAADNTVRAGDTLEEVTGVIDFGPATASGAGAQSYKIHPETRPVISRANQRSAVPDAVGGNVRVASANVLNFFTTFTNGRSFDLPNVTGQTCMTGCRGADDLNEFTRQRNKIVASLSALNADVVGLMEIQNNGNTAVQNLTNALNSVMGAGTYAPVPIPAGAGATGTDAIRVAMIYKPAKLSLQGPSVSDTNGVHNRPPFAQGFAAANGEKFAVVVNHFKSKGCGGASGADADQGDLQGCFNATRKNQADRLMAWLPTVKTAAATQDVILLGDFNAYALEEPMTRMIDGSGIVDLIARFAENDYSYVFDAFAGRLDQVVGTASIVPKITGANSWHINADEPVVIDYNTDGKPATDYYTNTAYRSSDHDPLILGLNLLKSVKGGGGRDTLVGTAGDDVIEGGPGADTLTGGAGRDQFVYANMTDVGDTITDFTVGQDTLDFSRLLGSLAITSAAPLASGHVTCLNQAAGAVIGVDNDGTAGPAKSRAVLQLKGVNCSAITAASFKFL